MTAQHFESIAELALTYRSDLDAGHDDGWWSDAEYTADAEHGTLHFRPRAAASVASESAPEPSVPPVGGFEAAEGEHVAEASADTAATGTASGATTASTASAAGWSVAIDLPGGALERSFSGAPLPAPAEAARQLEALARQALPARHEERERVIGQLRELAAQRHKIDSEARRIALDAVARGVKKIAVADAARISRVTLDKWIRDHTGRD